VWFVIGCARPTLLTLQRTSTTPLVYYSEYEVTRYVDKCASSSVARFNLSQPFVVYPEKFPTNEVPATGTLPEEFRNTLPTAHAGCKLGTWIAQPTVFIVLTVTYQGVFVPFVHIESTALSVDGPITTPDPVFEFQPTTPPADPLISAQGNDGTKFAHFDPTVTTIGGDVFNIPMVQPTAVSIDGPQTTQRAIVTSDDIISVATAPTTTRRGAVPLVAHLESTAVTINPPSTGPLITATTVVIDGTTAVATAEPTVLEQIPVDGPDPVGPILSAIQTAGVVPDPVNGGSNNGGNNPGNQAGGQPPVVVLGPSTFSMISSQFLVGGQTIVPGGPAVNIDGTTISIAPQATQVIVGTSTVQFPVATGSTRK